MNSDLKHQETKVAVEIEGKYAAELVLWQVY